MQHDYIADEMRILLDIFAEGQNAASGGSTV